MNHPFEADMSEIIGRHSGCGAPFLNFKRSATNRTWCRKNASVSETGERVDRMSIEFWDAFLQKPLNRRRNNMASKRKEIKHDVNTKKNQTWRLKRSHLHMNAKLRATWTDWIKPRDLYSAPPDSNVNNDYSTRLRTSRDLLCSGLTILVAWGLRMAAVGNWLPHWQIPRNPHPGQTLREHLHIFPHIHGHIHGHTHASMYVCICMMMRPRGFVRRWVYIEYYF